MHRIPAHDSNNTATTTPSPAPPLPRNYNTGEELESIITSSGVYKAQNPIDKLIFLGLLAGIFVFLSGMFAVSLAGGIPVDVRSSWPMLPKLAVAVSFPVGLVFILLFGGELFTGNTMIMTIAYLNKRVTFLDLIINWIVVFLSNFIIILFFTYLFAFQTGIFTVEPFNSFLIALAQKKCGYSFAQALLLSIPANTLVCLAIFLGLAARDVTGKVLGMYLPIATFAATGWEHCVGE